MFDKKSILIVCGTPAGQMYLGVLLNRIWYAPMLSRNAEEGIQLAQTTPIDIVLFDADMPSSDVMSSLMLIKNCERLCDKPIVLFTSDHRRETTEYFLSVGCIAVLTKPLDLSMVYGVLGRLCTQPRHAFRTPVNIPVEVLSGSRSANVEGINISEGGLYLKTTDALKEDDSLRIRFQLPRDNDPITMTARVVRSLPQGVHAVPETGVGLQFIEPDEHAVRRIRNFVHWETTKDLDWNTDAACVAVESDARNGNPE